MAPNPTQAQLRKMARIALSRGLPEEDAEDVVAASWHKAVAAYSADRGGFEALLARIVQREAIEWWRRNKRRPRVEPGRLELLESPTLPDLGQVEANQRRLLDSLSPDERRVFTTWALQKHLPQGALDAAGAAARLGMTVPEFNNAKRRLKSRIVKLAETWGLPPRAFFSVAEDEGPRKGVRHVG